jgi:monoamine oxidase
MYDFIIIGGGVSGAYCAHKLKKMYPNASIIVLEKGSKIGGRLQSFELENSPIQAEHGGMRFFPKVQPNVANIVKEFKIPIVKVDYVNSNNLLYIDGKRVRVKDYFYKNGETSTQIIDKVIDHILKSYNLTWHNVEDNREIAQQNIKTLLAKYIPFDVLVDYSITSGYNFVLGDISAATFIKEHQALSYQEDSPQYMVKTGYKTVPEMLLQDIDVKLNRLVVELLPKKEYTIVKYQQIIPTNIDIDIQPSNKIGNSETLYGRKIICTMMPLEAQQIYNWPNNIKNVFNNLYKYSATKIYIQFKNNWWKKLGLTGGKSTTDLPLRQIWYWNDNTIQIYCDMYDAMYWAKYFDSKPYPNWSAPNEAPELVKELLKQLAIVHGIDESEMEITRLSWIYWNAGAYFFKPSDIKKLEKDMVEPLPNIYFANSCYSGFQGFVEGSLISANNVLNKM